MAKRIHFEDNIFFINVHVRMLKDALALDLDPEFFLEKTVFDLEFLDSVLKKLLKALVENERILEREEQLSNLRDLEQAYGSLLLDLQNHKGNLGEAFKLLMEKIGEWRKASKERILCIQGIAPPKSGEQADPLVVSSEELNELLKGMM